MSTTTDSRPAPSPEAAEQAALREAKAALRPKDRRVWPWVLASQAAVLVAGYLGMPWFTTHLQFDPAALAAEENAVLERAREYRAQEEAERAQREIRQEHLDPLKLQEREARRKEVVTQVWELEAIAERVREKRNEHLTRLMEAPSEPAPAEAQTRMAKALAAFKEASNAVRENQRIEEREPYAQAADALLVQAEDARGKANSPPGLEPRDREAVSENLGDVAAALAALRETNHETWTHDLAAELDEAQDTVNLLRNLPTQLRQARQHQQTATSRLRQQRNRYLDDIKREVDRFQHNHRGLLAQKNQSPGVTRLADAIDALRQTSLGQKADGQWNPAALQETMATFTTAVEASKNRIRDVQALGDPRETQGLTGILHNHQRQADGLRNQWEQLRNRQTDETRRHNGAIESARSSVRTQWTKTAGSIDAAERTSLGPAVGKLLDGAAARTGSTDTSPPPPADAFKAEADRVAAAAVQAAAEDPSAKREAEGLRKGLGSLSHEIARQTQTAQRHADDRAGLLNRIRNEWRNAAKQATDKAERAAPALGAPQREPEEPTAAELNQVRTGLQKVDAQNRQRLTASGLTPDNVTGALQTRSQDLSELRQKLTRLNQTQKKLQQGIARDESTRLDRNLAHLARSIGLKQAEVQRQQTRQQDDLRRRIESLQPVLDRLQPATAKAAELDSAEARAVATALALVPTDAATLMNDASAAAAFTDQTSQAQEKASAWLDRASGRAPLHQQQMAAAQQRLHELSATMTEAGLSRQNAAAAAALLALPPPDPSAFDLSTLNSTVRAAEALHDSIASDFQTLRAADIAARTDQSFEHLRRAVESGLTQASAMDVPSANEEIHTVGDLNAYRAAMDQAVAQTEHLTQNARTMQRQALDEDDPALARALQQARAAAQGQAARSRARVHIGPDPRGDDSSSYSDTWHEMTFEKTPVRTQRLDVERIKAEALPGRRFTNDSPRRGWLYVDTWYVIGPWENHGEIDWRQVHPPEFEVDLAKSYPGGKDGRQLHWQFTQHPTIRCDVPDEQVNSTYYAWTEIYFDEPREMLVAIASNDAGKLWINDTVIWQDDGLSIWNMDEGFRRVRFKQGFSKVLMRIENGPRFCQYSLLLCPPDV